MICHAPTIYLYLFPNQFLMSYQRLNIIFGWIVFLIAAYTFVSTIEPTVSFWDCGEFIASAFKLEVGHPPGAPFFMLIGRAFTAFSDKTVAAKMINIVSALSSALTIVFLFWTITHLAKKMVSKGASVLTSGQMMAILGSGFVGSLSYCFSDTFWFSAVEGEVYAMSSLFTAVVFWAILKWENVADQPHANRWIIFIAYLMGLSIGVHLLNLLAIPAIVFVYYFRKYEPTQKGLIYAAIGSILLLGIIQGGIIPQTIVLASKFELFFTNVLGLPFNTGLSIYILLIIGFFVWAIHTSQKQGKVLANTIYLSIAVILIGYSTFTLIMVRSNANPPMDENNPEHMFSLLSYLNREQYGDRPLLMGQQFNSPLDNKKPYEDGNPVYFQDKKSGKYIISDDRKESLPNYASEFTTLFPRMYSSEDRHVNEYKSWTDFEGKGKRYLNPASGQVETIYMPTFGENLKFFVSYQINWMYFRYFMWNFAGRQNDVQGHGNPLDGNWLTGITAFDEWRLGPQDNLPTTMKNKAHNRYYMLPLILGILGILYQYRKNQKDALVVGLLFLFTGLAIVVYLNQYPLQPRERDYAYAASFYAFTIWIGLGVLFIYDVLKKLIQEAPSAIVTTVACTALVPAILAKENLDDHDRSNTYTARDFAMNYLNSCEENAILFTNGDNDTFPLWYVQEVEEYRTDVRVCNLSLLNTDWYVDQMRRKAYESEATPFGLAPEKYRQGTRDYLPVNDRSGGREIYLDIKEAMKFVGDDSKAAMYGKNRRMNYFPTKKFSLKVDSAKVLSNGTLDPRLADRLLPEIRWDISKNYVFKNDMMIMDLLANFNWDKPVYFAITTGNAAYIGLDDHFQLEGLSYRLVPMKTSNPDGQTGYIHTDKMYNNLMNKFVWGGVDKHDIYMNENNRRMCMNLRNNFARLADALVRENKKDSAIKVLDRCLEVLPENNVPYDYFILPVSEAYYRAGAADKANKLMTHLFALYEEEVTYLLRFNKDMMKGVASQLQQDSQIMMRISQVVKMNQQEALAKDFEKRMGDIQAKLQQSGAL